MNNNNQYPVKYKKLSKEELKRQIDLYKSSSCEEAYVAILSHMHKYLCYIQTKFYIQGSDENDVYQEGAIKLINAIQSYDSNKSSFDTFAQNTIRKHIITSLNKQKAQKRKVLNTSYSLDATDDINDDSTSNNQPKYDYLSNNENEFFEILKIIEKDYEQYFLSQIMESLSKMEGKVFVLRFVEQMSYREIAVALNLYKIGKKNKRKTADTKAIDNAIWRSKPKIKSAMKKIGIGPIKLIDNIKKGDK